MNYRYSAYVVSDKDGMISRQRAGRLATNGDPVAALRAQGKEPLSIVPIGTSAFDGVAHWLQRVPAQHLQIFWTTMGFLAPLPRKDALTIAAQRCDHPRLAAAIRSAARDTEAASLSDALAKCPEFPATQVALVSAVDEARVEAKRDVYTNLAEYAEQDVAIGRVLSATAVKSAVLLAVIIGGLAWMSSSFVPMVLGITHLIDASAALPPITRVALSVLGVFRPLGLLTMATVVGGAVLAARIAILHDDHVALRYEAFIERVPHLGRLVVRSETAAIARALEVTIPMRGGADALEAVLPVARRKRTLFGLRDAVRLLRSGDAATLGESIERANILDPALPGYLGGADTGTTADKVRAFREAARFLEAEATRAANELAKAVEPAIMTVSVVSFYLGFFALFYPFFNFMLKATQLQMPAVVIH